MNTWTAKEAAKVGLLIAALALFASSVMADDTDVATDRIADRVDDRGDRIEDRLDDRGAPAQGCVG